MRILICGDRHWTDYGLILTYIDMYAPTTVIEGEARGADKLAAQAARIRGIQVLPFPADWSKHKRAAGPIRNQQMINEGKPDMVLAFHDDLTHSKGTLDMVTRARKAGLRVVVVSHAGAVEMADQGHGFFAE